MTYRVVSADSHPVSGGYVFSVGEGGATPGATVSELLGAPRSGPSPTVAFWAARWIGYVAIGLAIGVVAFLLLARAQARGRGRRRPSRAAARSLCSSCAAGGPDREPGLAGAPGRDGRRHVLLVDALDPDVLGDVLDTRYGTLAVVRAGAWLAFAGLVAARCHAVVAHAAARGSGGLTGVRRARLDPGSVVAPRARQRPARRSRWACGSAGSRRSFCALPVATRRLDPAERSSGPGDSLVALLAPSRSAAWSRSSLTGTVQSIVYLGPLTDLFDTAFGRAVLIKLVLLGDRWSASAPSTARRLAARDSTEWPSAREPGTAGVALRRALRAEVALDRRRARRDSGARLLPATRREASQGPVSGTTEVGYGRPRLHRRARGAGSERDAPLPLRRRGRQPVRPRRRSSTASSRAAGARTSARSRPSSERAGPGPLRRPLGPVRRAGRLDRRHRAVRVSRFAESRRPSGCPSK